MTETWHDIKDSAEDFAKDPAGFVGDAMDKLRANLMCAAEKALPKCYSANCRDGKDYLLACPVERGCFNQMYADNDFFGVLPAACVSMANVLIGKPKLDSWKFNVPWYSWKRMRLLACSWDPTGWCSYYVRGISIYYIEKEDGEISVEYTHFKTEPNFKTKQRALPDAEATLALSPSQVILKKTDATGYYQWTYVGAIIFAVLLLGFFTWKKLLAKKHDQQKVLQNEEAYGQLQ